MKIFTFKIPSILVDLFGAAVLFYLFKVTVFRNVSCVLIAQGKFDI